MLAQKITTKLDMIKLIQGSQIKKIIASDIKSNADLEKIKKEVEQLVRSNQDVTIFAITT